MHRFSTFHPYKQWFVNINNLAKITEYILCFSVTYFCYLQHLVTSVHYMRNVWRAGRVVWLWAVSSGASGQTVQRPTVTLPSGFWRHWRACLPRSYIPTGSEIAVSLGVELYLRIDNGARIYFWKACALVSTGGFVGLRIIYCITTWMTWNVQYSWFSKNNVLLV